MQDLKVGVVQTKQHWENNEENYSHFESIFQNHFEGKDVDLVILPEMFNTGFSMEAQKLAETEDGPSVKWLIDQASKLNCQIAASLIINDNGSFYNRMMIVDGTGILNRYDKRHLFRMAGENEHFTAGENRVIHELNGWRIMLQICYDLRFPVFSRNKMVDGKKDYDLCLYVANWPEKRVYAWRNLLQARAIENQSFVIGVNRIGTDGNEIPYSGDSMIIDPWGNVVLDCADHEEVVKLFTLSSETLNDIFEKFPVFLDAD